MRNIAAGLALTLIGWLAAGSTGASQETGLRQNLDEIRAYEHLIQQPAAANDGAAWWKLAMLYQDAARYGNAEHAYTKALEFLKTEDSKTLANVMDCMGTMYVEIGQFSQAEQLEQKALVLRKEQKDQLGIGLSWMHLAMLSLGKMDYANGEMYAELAVERLVDDHKESEATPEEKMTALTYLALARCAGHACSGAVSPLRKAVKIAEGSNSGQSFPAAYIEYLEGYADWKLGKNGDAAKLMQSGTKGMEAQLGWGHPTYVSALRQYEAFLVATRRNSEAAEVRAKLAKLNSTQGPEQSARTEDPSLFQR